MSRRFLVTYVALAVVVLASLEIPLGIEHGRSERRDLTGRIERDALTMATFAEDTLERGLTKPPAGLVRLATRYQADPGGRVVIVDATGLSVLDTSPPAPGRRSFASRPEFASALEGNIASGTRHSNTLHANLIYVAVPIASGGVVRGAVRITYPTSALDARVLRYWLLLAAIGGVVLSLAVVVGVGFARTLTGPLSALEDAAAAVGAGDLKARAPEAGPPEIRALAAEFNQTVARLDTLLRSQEEFVADASHQLRTPLAALRLRLENLEADAGGGAATAGLEAALAEVNRLARLVDGLLALARADASRPAPEPADLRSLVAARLDAWSAELASRQVAAENRVPDGLRALATPGSLEQVLDNLVSNAIAVSKPGGVVTIDAEPAGAAVELHVRDDGPGMSAEQRARALDRFWRAGPPGSGTGLGLAIVHRLVSADGGTVELREAPGGGLDVVVRLGAAA